MPLTAEQVEEIATRAASKAACKAVREEVHQEVHKAVEDAANWAAERAAVRAAQEASLSRDDTRLLIGESVRQTLIQLGVESESPIEMQKDFQHLRNWRLSGEEIKRKSVITVIGIFLTGLAGLIWVGIKGGGS